MRRLAPALLALAVAASLAGAVPAGAAQVVSTGLSCGADVDAGTLRPTADVRRDTYFDDERVAVQLALLDGDTTVATLGTGRVEADGTTSPNGAYVVLAGTTRQFRPGGAAFGDGNVGGTVEREKPYTVRVRITDFDDFSVVIKTYGCTLPAKPPDDVTLTVQKAGAGTGTVTGPAGLCLPARVHGDRPARHVGEADRRRRGRIVFGGWGAAECPGTDPCTLELKESRTVQARFDPAACKTRDLAKADGGLTSVTFKDVVKPRGMPVNVRTKLVLSRLGICELGIYKAPGSLPDANVDPGDLKGTVWMPVANSPAPGFFTYEVRTGLWLGVPGTEVEVDPTLAVQGHPPVDNTDVDHENQIISYDWATVTLPSYTVQLLGAPSDPNVFTATTERKLDIKIEIDVKQLKELMDRYGKLVKQEAVPLVVLQLEEALRAGTIERLGERWREFPGSITTAQWTGLASKARAAVVAGHCLSCIFNRALTRVIPPEIQLQVLQTLVFVSAIALPIIVLTRGYVRPAFPVAHARAAQAGAAPQKLAVRRAGRLVARGWKRGKVPPKEAAHLLADELVGVAGVQTRIAALALKPATLKPGATLTVAAAGLPKPKHDAQLTLAGPNGERLSAILGTSKGVAVARVTLPRRMAKGTWTLAVADLSALDVQGTAVKGRAEVRAATFRVR